MLGTVLASGDRGENTREAVPALGKLTAWPQAPRGGAVSRALVLGAIGKMAIRLRVG